MKRFIEINNRVIDVKFRPLGWYVIACTVIMTAKILRRIWDVLWYAFDTFTI